MPHSLVQILRGVPDFSPLDERSLLAIVGESLNLFWRAGSLIFEPGLPGDALYIILSGEVVIYAETGEEVARLGAGDSFREISFDLHPHWWYFVPVATLAVVIAGAAVVVTVTLRDATQTYTLLGVAVFAVIWLMAFLVKLAEWRTTHFVLTTDRLIVRSGVL